MELLKVDSGMGVGKEASYDASRYAFVDVEVGMSDRKIHDIGALRYDDAVYHAVSKEGLVQFIDGVDYLCGHNS